MNREMKTAIKSAIATLAVMTSLQSAMAAGQQKEGGIGNGGGAWVCREQNGEIRSAMSVDFLRLRLSLGSRFRSIRARPATLWT